MIFKILISTVYNEVQYRPVTLSYLLIDTTLKREEEEEKFSQLVEEEEQEQEIDLSHPLSFYQYN